MGFVGSLYKFLIMIACLAIYRIAEPSYFAWVYQQSGATPGFGHIMVGYGVAAGFAWLFVYFTAHRLETDIN